MARRNTQRRNPEPITIAALVVVGVAAGGALGYVIATRKATHDILEQFGIDKWRLPVPSYKVHVPDTDEDFVVIDEVICECAGPIIDAAPDEAPLEEVVDKARLCVAKALHPDFAWPPAPGDHPTVSQLWAELAVLVRAAIVTDSVCEGPRPKPLEIPVPKP